ncbi:hypothetical protein K1T71_008310, partial [Dendrolimus kikuchii]
NIPFVTIHRDTHICRYFHKTSHVLNENIRPSLRGLFIILLRCSPHEFYTRLNDL